MSLFPVQGLCGVWKGKWDTFLSNSIKALFFSLFMFNSLNSVFNTRVFVLLTFKCMVMCFLSCYKSRNCTTVKFLPSIMFAGRKLRQDEEI